jgi:iron-sulfur cluster assembly protein
MITLSPLAVEKIQGIIGQQENSETLALRLFVNGMGCSGPSYGMALDDKEVPGDTILSLDGLRILIDPDSAPLLAGSEVDFRDSLMGAGFTINNPNVASSGGGCGGGCACQR